MPKRESGLEVDVPDRCYEIKDHFRTRPTTTAVKEIKQFIDTTGQPFMWPGHTHTRPPDGSLPVYLDEFEISDRLRRVGRLSPCPCCWPRHAKFAKGRIAWFPDEGVIRLMGADCFRSLNKDAHEDAEREMRQRKQREADVTYLLKHHDRLKRAYWIAKDAEAIAHAIATLSKHLRKTFEDRLNLQIWPYVQRGRLSVWEEFSQVVGDGEVRQQTRERDYASLSGFEMLSPSPKDFVLRMAQVRAGFEKAFEEDDWDSFVVALSDQDRHSLARLISKSVGSARKWFAEMRELQRFVSEVNVATFRTWGRHEGNALKFIFESDGTKLTIGRNENAKLHVEIPSDIHIELQDIDLPLIKESSFVS